MKNKNLFPLLIMFFLSVTGYGQIPTDVPKPSDKPIDLTEPADVIIYIILPLGAIILYFIWRQKKKKEK